MNHASKSGHVAEFWAAPDEAFFNQATIAAVLCCSEAKMERDRWAGTGTPYHKIGRRCLYRKADVVKWIEGHSPTLSSSSEMM
jgi:hypothetical protein